MSGISKALALGMLAQKAPKADVAKLQNPTGINSPWGNNDAPIYLSAGQSNECGYYATMDAGDQISTALTNVFCLKTTRHKNLTFTDVTWEGYTSLGDCNLGNTNIDHLYCQATEFARLWQAHITSGNALGLPNLYVVRMSTAGTGMFPGSTIDHWSFTRAPTDLNSLFPRYMKTLKLAITNLKNAGKNPRIIIQNWNQWEAEADSAANNGTTLVAKDYAAVHFMKMIQSIRDATGCPELRFDFYYPIATTYPAANISAVKKGLISVVSMDPKHLGFNDVRNAPNYTGVSPNFGVFGSDNVHYNGATHKWFAAQQFARVTAGDKGVPAGVWPHGTRPLRDIEADVAAVKQPTQFLANNYTVSTNVASVPGLSYDAGAANHTFAIQRSGSTKSILASRIANGYSLLKSTGIVSDTLNSEVVVSVQSGAYPNWLGGAFRVSADGVVGGGFSGVPYSYIAVSLGFDSVASAISSINVWVLWNSSIDTSATGDRVLQVLSTSFANPFPTSGKYKVRFRLIDTTVYVQSSTDGGVTWLNHITADNTAGGTPGKSFAFNAPRHASLVNVKTGGGTTGFAIGVGAASADRTTAVLDGFEFNMLP